LPGLGPKLFFLLGKKNKKLKKKNRKKGKMGKVNRIWKQLSLFLFLCFSLSRAIHHRQSHNSHRRALFDHHQSPRLSHHAVATGKASNTSPQPLSFSLCSEKPLHK
jgi:hypothetical protein